VYGREVQARTEEKRRLAGAQNRQAGTAFLAANKLKSGVTTLPSGLQYEVLERGDGGTPKATDTVTTHYRGTFLDGKVFDSSVERGEPMTRSVSQVIRGWTEALQRMKVGDKWRLFVPSELAYGPTGFGELIGPHTVLIFEIELLGIE
jgi:FKBP-type peptidyl-prolyl cis-trans isomerase FklB